MAVVAVGITVTVAPSQLGVLSYCSIQMQNNEMGVTLLLSPGWVVAILVFVGAMNREFGKQHDLTASAKCHGVCLQSDWRLRLSGVNYQGIMNLMMDMGVQW